MKKKLTSIAMILVFTFSFTAFAMSEAPGNTPASVPICCFNFFNCNCLTQK